MNSNQWSSTPAPPSGQLLGSHAATPGSARQVFVHQGALPLTVIGRETGRRYHFARAGARVAVDARDAPQLARLPTLARAA